MIFGFAGVLFSLVKRLTLTFADSVSTVHDKNADGGTTDAVIEQPCSDSSVQKQSVDAKPKAFFIDFQEPPKRGSKQKSKRKTEPSSSSTLAAAPSVPAVSGDATFAVAAAFASASASMNTDEDVDYNEGYLKMQASWTMTYEAMWKRRKYLDTNMWLCISRPQYKFSCGISSLTACWNYLFSEMGPNVGVGKTLKVLTQEELLLILGFQPPFDAIRFGPFTGNGTLMRWFRMLCAHFGVSGRASIHWKPHGKMRTPGITSEQALTRLKSAILDPKMAVIYHCWNHYMCPMGFDDTPVDASQAYRAGDGQDAAAAPADFQTWILVGDSSRTSRAVHCLRWRDISADLESQMPSFLNIRKIEEGVQTRKNCKKVGGNLHCFIAFERLPDDYARGSGAEAVEDDDDDAEDDDKEELELEVQEA
eukprot:ANDGO_01076.mRNA.1 Basic immunoglobulin-like variable motif-containing protein